MSRVLVTGGSGFVGKSLLDALKTRGIGITLLRRTSSPPLANDAAAGIRIVEAEEPLTAASAARAMEGVETVVHLAGLAHQRTAQSSADMDTYLRINTGLPITLAAACMDAGVRNFLFMSTIGVHGELSRPGAPLTETSPTLPTTPYSVSKLTAETALQAMLAGRCNLVVLRPTLVCGVGARGNLQRLLGLATSGVPLPFGAVRNRRTLVSLQDLTGAVLAVIDAWSRGDRSGTFVIGDRQPVSLSDILAAYRRGAGRGGATVPVPPPLLRLALRMLRRRRLANQLLGDLEVDSSRFRAEFGWDPPSSVLSTLEAMGRSAR